MGTLSRLRENVALTKESDRQEYISTGSIMLNADEVVDFVNAKNPPHDGLGRPLNKIGDLISTPNNQGLIKEFYLSRFGHHPAVPNPSIKIINK